MAYLTANGAPVAEGVITVPLVGRLRGTLLVSSQAEVSIQTGDAVPLQFEDGTTYMATAFRAGLERGRLRLVVIGGAGKLGQAMKFKGYQNAPPARVLKDIVEEAGESPGTISLPGTLEAWAREASTADAAIRALMMEFPDHHWRIGMDGKLTAAAETWPAGPAVTELEARPENGSYLLAPVPALWPGMALPQGKVVRVVQHVAPGGPKTEVWTRG